MALRATQSLLSRQYISTTARMFSTTRCQCLLQKMSRVRVVDNSQLGRAAEIAGKPAKVIHVYTKNSKATIGDRVLLAIQGQKKRAYVVGVRKEQRHSVARFDTNNVVLIEDNGAPTGTRIRLPIPSKLRGQEGDFTKILSMATKFV